MRLIYRFDCYRLAVDLIAVCIFQNPGNEFFRDIYKCVLMFDEDHPQCGARYIGVEGNRAHYIARTDTMSFAGVQNKPDHPCFVGSI